MTNPTAPPDPASPPHLQLHASCASWRGTGVLLLGGAGSGKSDLLLRLIDRGFALVADDRVLIEAGQARAPDALAGLIEVRGLGLLRVAHQPATALGLVVALDDAAMSAADPAAARPDGQGPGTARLPRPAWHRILGLPLLRIEPFAASAACRVEIALDCLDGRRTLVVGGLP